MNNEPVVRTMCLACGKRVTGDSIHTCSPQLKQLTDEEIDFIKEIVGGYICTVKMEIDQEKQAFKGYEHCSNISSLTNELKDAEKALAILRKAQEQ